jgi:hypothetical protein
MSKLFDRPWQKNTPFVLKIRQSLSAKLWGILRNLLDPACRRNIAYRATLAEEVRVDELIATLNANSTGSDKAIARGTHQP